MMKSENEDVMKSRKSKRERRRTDQVRVAFERAHLDAARLVLEQAGVATGERNEAAALALFTIGLGMLSGHYTELLAKRLREAHVLAFGPDGPARFREAAMNLHVGATMPELAAELLDGGAAPGPHGAPKPVH